MDHMNIVESNRYTRGKFLLGTNITISSPEKITSLDRAYVLILPWNLKGEITPQLSDIWACRAKFAVPIPEGLLI